MAAGSPKGGSQCCSEVPAMGSFCFLSTGLDVLARRPQEPCTQKDQKLLPATGLLGDCHHSEISAAAPLHTHHCLLLPTHWLPTHSEPSWQPSGPLWPTGAPDVPSDLLDRIGNAEEVVLVPSSLLGALLCCVPTKLRNNFWGLQAGPAPP